MAKHLLTVSANTSATTTATTNVPDAITSGMTTADLAPAPYAPPSQAFQQMWQNWNQQAEGQGELLAVALLAGLAVMVWLLFAYLRDPHLGWRERFGFFGFWLASVSGTWFLIQHVSVFFALFLLAIALPIAKDLLRAKRAERLHRAAPRPAPTGRVSEMHSAYLTVFLNHDTQHISGHVLQGKLAGFGLHELDPDDLHRLYTELAEKDATALQLYIAWLNRHGPPLWHRDWPQARAQHSHTHQQQTVAPQSEMSRKEALQVLGLDDHCTTEQIDGAFKQLMARLHPDRGGSNYLAQLLNEARKVLAP